MSIESVALAPSVLERIERLRDNVEATIRGKTDVVDRVIVCLLAGGHILIEDLPGLGKTTLAHCLARSIDCGFSRIQFTSDLLPSDVIGVSIYDERIRDFTFQPGPIFSNIVLADEINRTTPKTQSSLLEVMGRAQISVDGTTHVLPPPFMVIATQNPVDYEGTFPLPDSQMDRFLMRIEMGYPAYESELEILKYGHLHYDDSEVAAVLSQSEVLDLQALTRQVFVEDSVYAYMVQLAAATRQEAALRSGVSPRGTLALKAAAQATALTAGRSFVLPEDVRAVVQPVFAHRLALAQSMADPLEERRSVAGLLQQVVERVEEPS